ncbi:MAG: tRNA (guanosine(46)-N7)-methyltransferase TrmB [Planctomycetes bacterium]|jgi:tRNA (guanine-N7-)-methyltransferase|nr:tRNA (guanosine(46)-N7)-methyltransferase TrmB [Planctomycetota bacterium]MCL4730138.1 tRNA (guanosine(46)-N7)-methyltransferase TrmB [Planctomycetota bacterium]
MARATDIAPVVLPAVPQGVAHRHDLAAVFGNNHPVELELGVGKGRFLIQSAEQNPGVNFLGVEWAGRYFRLVAERAARRGLANFRIVRDDAAHLVRDNLADACIAVLHIYFPDPWPKARHHKRRLIQPPFARQCARVLQPGGLVRLATDHEDYAQQMEQVFLADPDFTPTWRAVGADAPQGVTNWEQKFRAQGRTIHKFEFRRVTS